ncbi:MAG: hypothetical protein JWP82_2941 [Humibacillus sp.]|nr:hypothetical protein [Humibacillus sp.]
MTWLAIVLIGLGVGDLVRSSAWGPARVAAHVATPVVILVVAVLSDVDAWLDLLALAVGAALAAVWMELSRRTQRTGHGALAALGVFVLLVVGLVGFSGAASAPGGPLAAWLGWADLPTSVSPSASRVLLLAGLVAFNVATANVIVRLVLLAIGALSPDAVAASSTRPPPGQPAQPADRLKGGRLLGPMERLVIVGLGLAGEFGAAGIVIAAKGLLRFPEVQAAARRGATGTAGAYAGGPAGIDDVTEYFLVGSFVSWLIALGSLALVV